MSVLASQDDVRDSTEETTLRRSLRPTKDVPISCLREKPGSEPGSLAPGRSPSAHVRHDVRSVRPLEDLLRLWRVPHPRGMRVLPREGHLEPFTGAEDPSGNAEQGVTVVDLLLQAGVKPRDSKRVSMASKPLGVGLHSTPAKRPRQRPVLSSAKIRFSTGGRRRSPASPCSMSKVKES